MYTAPSGFICLSPRKSSYWKRCWSCCAPIYVYTAPPCGHMAVASFAAHVARNMLGGLAALHRDGLPWMGMIAVAVSFLLLCMISDSDQRTKQLPWFASLAQQGVTVTSEPTKQPLHFLSSCWLNCWLLLLYYCPTTTTAVLLLLYTTILL